MPDASFASLSPTLLARKGSARPAMRPQVQPLGTSELNGQGFAAHPQDDLGWNDMGDDAPNRESADVLAFEAREPADSDKPAVLRQRDDFAARVAQPAPKKPAAPRRKAIAQGRRAAFTLRIEPERHLKLRLACTLTDRSAQSLITEALDVFLEAQDGLAAAASKLGAKRRSN